MTVTLNQIRRVIHTVSSACENGLTSASEASSKALTYCAVFWLNGKLCNTDNSFGPSSNLLADDKGLQAAILTNLTCISLLAVAIATKQISATVMQDRR